MRSWGSRVLRSFVVFAVLGLAVVCAQSSTEETTRTRYFAEANSGI